MNGFQIQFRAQIRHATLIRAFASIYALQSSGQHGRISDLCQSIVTSKIRLNEMSYKQLKVTAIVAIRNGAFYFSRLCQHARTNGFSLAVIDNQSEDNLQQLIKQNLDVIETSVMLSYDGKFDLVKQLEAKASVAKNLDADWIIHLDVDELLFSNTKDETLQVTLSRIHDAGFNAVNFDEFVFLPIQRLKPYNAKNYHTMNWYYFFEPKPNRLIRAFHNTLTTQVTSGGHNVEGDLKLYSESMIMRHYMFENRRHAQTKYRHRIYSEQDLEKKFHRNRTLLQNKELFLPPKKLLLCAPKSAWSLDKSDPKATHFWEW